MRVKHILFISFLLIQTSILRSQVAPRVFSLDPAALLKNKKQLSSTSSDLQPAYKSLLKEADKALSHPLVSVMEKKQTPPSGNKHDYMSLAPYHWPDPTKKDGLPYIRKDGDTNPEVKDYKDKEYLPDLCDACYTLSLAWYFSGEQKYATQAAKLIRTWFLDTATRMNPNLNYGQAIKGVNTGRGSGLIDTRHFIKLIDAASLLEGSAQWNNADASGLKQWFSAFLDWMQTSVVGLDELDAPNNHGMWYDAQRLSMALYTGQAKTASDIVTSLKSRLNSQLDSAGLFPLELARTNSQHYSGFVLEALLNAAQLSVNTDQNLWNYVSTSGASAKKAVLALYPYSIGEKKWAYPNLKTYEPREALPVLFRGARYTNPVTTKEAIQRITGEKYDQLLYHLIIPIVQ